MQQDQITSVSPNSTNAMLVAGLNESAQIIYQNNRAKGFWDKERNVGELLMLVTSELGEAMEAHRKRKFADWGKMDKEIELSIEAGSNPDNTANIQFGLWVKDSFPDEIADAIIRLLDLSAGFGIDLEKHINAKVRYNESRPRLHGKSY